MARTSCKDCTDRKVGCRSDCDYWKKHEKAKAKRYKKANVDRITDNALVEGCIRVAHGRKTRS